MTTSLPSRDEASIPLWNDAYRTSEVEQEGNLWGDPPVPHAAKAAALFAEADAKVVLDLPCGDGRNLPPLAQGAPILLAGDTSTNAMAIAESVARKGRNPGQGVFVEVDAFHTGLLAGSVDGIFCWDLLGHLTNPRTRWRNFGRILAPGGQLVANMWTMNDCQVYRPRDQGDRAEGVHRPLRLLLPLLRRAGPGALLARWDSSRRVSADVELVGAAARRLPRLRARAREPHLHHRQASGLTICPRWSNCGTAGAPGALREPPLVAHRNRSAQGVGWARRAHHGELLQGTFTEPPGSCAAPW